MVLRKEVKISFILVLMAIFLVAVSGVASADLASGPAYYLGAGTFTTFDFSGSPTDLIVSVDNGTPVTITLNQNYPDAISLENAINSKIKGATVDISYSSWVVHPDGSKEYFYDAYFQTDTWGSKRSIYVAGSAAPRLGLDTITPANGTTGATWKAARQSFPSLDTSPSFPREFTVAVDGGVEQKITLNQNYPDLNSIINGINSQLKGATVFDTGGGILAFGSNNPNPASSAIIVHVPFYELGFSQYRAGEDTPPPTPSAPRPIPVTVPRTSTPVYSGQVLMLGSQRQAVNDVQEKLNKLGFDCGAIDGIYGPITRSAVIKFQESGGLVPDGLVGPMTWGKLFGFNLGNFQQNVGYNSSSTLLVSGIQDKLLSLGFNPGIIDGIFGNKTLAAVQSFQKTKGLAVDGIVGPITWKALFG